MSIPAGSLLHVAGKNVVDRLQSAGLGDVRIPVDTIREVGNPLVVDKVPGEPDFTFTMEGYDVSTELIAFLTGKYGGSASAAPAGSADGAGTVYKWSQCQFVNIASPWKDPNASAGTVEAGHLIPGYYPTRLRYAFGATDYSSQQVDLSGGSFYYAGYAPVEEFKTGNGSTVAFTTTDPTVLHERGGVGGTARNVFGVIVGAKLMIEGTDFTVTGGDGSAATITFASAPASGAVIRFTYFTTASKTYPPAVHASTLVKPGAVRGRNIHVYLGSGGTAARVAGVQSISLEATTDGTVDREMGNDEPTGRTVNGIDTNGDIVVRPKDSAAFLALLSKVTGVPTDEVFGFFNENTIPLVIKIENPKSPGTIIKTLRVSDAQFQPPGTPARVNQSTDFTFRWASLSGDFDEIVGDMTL
jgi:hypothetical protein